MSKRTFTVKFQQTDTSNTNPDGIVYEDNIQVYPLLVAAATSPSAVPTATVSGAVPTATVSGAVPTATVSGATVSGATVSGATVSGATVPTATVPTATVSAPVSITPVIQGLPEMPANIIDRCRELVKSLNGSGLTQSQRERNANELERYFGQYKGKLEDVGLLRNTTLNNQIYKLIRNSIPNRSNTTPSTTASISLSLKDTAINEISLLLSTLNTGMTQVEKDVIINKVANIYDINKGDITFTEYNALLIFYSVKSGNVFSDIIDKLKNKFRKNDPDNKVQDTSNEINQIFRLPVGSTNRDEKIKDLVRRYPIYGTPDTMKLLQNHKLNTFKNFFTRRGGKSTKKRYNKSKRYTTKKNR